MGLLRAAFYFALGFNTTPLYESYPALAAGRLIYDLSQAWMRISGDRGRGRIKVTA
ncbi:MAG: hypothetical protein LBF83_00050 [Spirochaetaceae bacterium]|jgi:hypothetical protein|nr:hypothetical protein [Spirochaetaceae bacterium]